MLTTREVAERLNVSMRRVLALIEVGRLPSQQFGRDHLIKEADLKLVENRKPGRPPKHTNSEKRATGQMQATAGTPSKKRRKK